MYLDRNQNGVLDLGTDSSPDVNGDGALTQDEDFVIMGQIQGQTGYRFSMEAITAAVSRDIFSGTEWPDFVPSEAETAEWWSHRSMAKDLQRVVEAWPDGAIAGVSYTEIDHGIALPSRPHIATLAQLFMEESVPLTLNASTEVATCVLSTDQLAFWSPAPELSGSFEETDLPLWGWPDSISSTTARYMGVLDVLWRAFGPIQTCPQLSKSRIP
jgi:hypothetical protein